MHSAVVHEEVLIKHEDALRMDRRTEIQLTNLLTALENVEPPA
jgi:hypothetical protein